MKTTYNLNVTSTDDGSDYSKSQSTSVNTNTPGDLINLLRKFEELEAGAAAPAVEPTPEPVMAAPAPCDAAIEEEGEALANAPKVKSLRDLLDIVTTGHTNTAPNRLTNKQGDNPLVQEETAEEDPLEAQLMTEWRATKLQAISENFDINAAHQAIVDGLETYVVGMNTFAVQRDQGYIKVFPIVENKVVDGAPLLVVSEDEKMIEADVWDTHELRHKSGRVLKKGDKVKDFRGDEHTVHGFQPPRHSGSTGGVYTTQKGQKHSGEYYPSVIDAEIVAKSVSEEVTESESDKWKDNWKNHSLVRTSPDRTEVKDIEGPGEVVMHKGKTYSIVGFQPADYPGQSVKIYTEPKPTLKVGGKDRDYFFANELGIKLRTKNKAVEEDWITKPGQDRDRPAHLRKKEDEQDLPDDHVSKKFKDAGNPDVPAADRKMRGTR